MAAIPEDTELWKNLDVSPATSMEDWFRIVPPLWSISPNPRLVSTIPDKVERTVKLFESLLL
eukprot:6062082-Alexandrium_andersonii.AAC.1